MSSQEWNRIKTQYTDGRNKIKHSRFAVVGTSCSGKTTISKAISEKLGIKYVEIDSIYWLPDWQKRPDKGLFCIIDKATLEDAWVTDGSYSRLHNYTLNRADVIVWLNYSFPLVFLRALRRTIKRSITQEELFAGCRESWYESFCTRNSILWWVITTFKKRRDQYRKIFNEKIFGDKTYVELHSQREADRFLREIKFCK